MPKITQITIPCCAPCAQLPSPPPSTPRLEVLPVLLVLALCGDCTVDQFAIGDDIIQQQTVTR